MPPPAVGWRYRLLRWRDMKGWRACLQRATHHQEAACLCTRRDPELLMLHYFPLVQKQKTTLHRPDTHGAHVDCPHCHTTTTRASRPSHGQRCSNVKQGGSTSSVSVPCDTATIHRGQERATRTILSPPYLALSHSSTPPSRCVTRVNSSAMGSTRSSVLIACPGTTIDRVNVKAFDYRNGSSQFLTAHLTGVER